MYNKENKINNLFLGVGAMKAGTSWIFEHIKGHPDIFFSHEKELSYFSYIHNKKCKWALESENRIQKVHFFMMVYKKSNFYERRDLFFWANKYLASPINDTWYINNFLLRNNEKYCADFSNLYSLIGDNGWNHIKAITKNLKVIYVIRDPVDRLWSHTKFQLRIDNKIKDIKNWNEKQWIDYMNVEHLLQHSEYKNILQVLSRNLNSQQLLVLNFHDITKKPSHFLNKIEGFLGIKKTSYTLDILNNKINSSNDFIIPSFIYNVFKDRFLKDIVYIDNYKY